MAHCIEGFVLGDELTLGLKIACRLMPLCVGSLCTLLLCTLSGGVRCEKEVFTFNFSTITLSNCSFYYKMNIME